MAAPEGSWRECLLEGSEALVAGWLAAPPVRIFLAGNRRSKNGDFRVPRNGRPACITINQDLHPVEFMLTLAHEIAHFRNWNKRGRRVRPHGEEWRNEFRLMLAELLETGLMGKEVEEAIVRHYFRRKLIGSGSSEQLNRLLGKNKEVSGILRVGDLPEGARFTLRSGRTFIKGKKLRKRYRCSETVSSRIYSVHPMAEVKETVVS